jgi:hypothetical protein
VFSCHFGDTNLSFAHEKWSRIFLFPSWYAVIPGKVGKIKRDKGKQWNGFHSSGISEGGNKIESVPHFKSAINEVCLITRPQKPLAKQ